MPSRQSIAKNQLNGDSKSVKKIKNWFGCYLSEIVLISYKKLMDICIIYFRVLLLSAVHISLRLKNLKPFSL